MRFVKRCWTDSTLSILCWVWGDQIGEQYSRRGPTKVINALVKISGWLERKLFRISLARMCALWTINEMCLENVNFESKTIPRSRVSVDQFKNTLFNEYTERHQWWWYSVPVFCGVLTSSAPELPEPSAWGLVPLQRSVVTSVVYLSFGCRRDFGNFNTDLGRGVF
jgi:hypothetical protein